MNRRDFLQIALMGVATMPSLPAFAAAPQNPVAPSDRIRMGVIGTGNRGNEVMQTWLRYQDSVFVAICDVDFPYVERSLTRPEGLRSRPWYRNLIYAADENNGYANIVFPSVNEAIRTGDAALTQREIDDLARRFDEASAALDDAARILRR